MTFQTHKGVSQTVVTGEIGRRGAAAPAEPSDRRSRLPPVQVGSPKVLSFSHFFVLSRLLPYFAMQKYYDNIALSVTVLQTLQTRTCANVTFSRCYNVAFCRGCLKGGYLHECRH